MLLETSFAAPSEIQSVLGIPTQQMQQGGKLYETYQIGDERVSVQYEWVPRE